MNHAYIVSACRTPIGSFGGSLKDVEPIDLGALVLKNVLARANLSGAEVDEVVLGNVLQAGLGQNVARQVAIRAGLPQEVPAWTLNKVCGSGLKSVNYAAQAIKAGDCGCIIAGGVESMSRAPYLLNQHRWGERMGNGTLIDYMINDGLWDVFGNYHMGITAENVARLYDIARKEQDDFAYESQCKALRARDQGRFAQEIVPVVLPQKKGEPVVFDKDEHMRETTPDKLAKLKPAFKDEGSVTAGNSSGINDGAAALLIASEAFIKTHGLIPLAKIVSYGSKGVAPQIMGMGPVPSVRSVLEKSGLSVDQIDLVEANEAFAAQALAVMRELGLAPGKVNVNGGAIALGHPIGASGARILVTLLHEMKRRECRYGLATLCIGGGMGEATIVERDALCG